MSAIISKTVAELEIDDGELRMAKQKLSQEKHSLQGMIAEINSKCTTRLSQNDYHKIQKLRASIVNQLQQKEGEIADINSRRHELLTVLEVRKQQSNKFQPDDIRLLVSIRDKWHDFSMESKNPKAARDVAWKISQEIRAFLLPYFQTSIAP